VTGGKVGASERRALAEWAGCLNAEAGAEYLNDILLYADGFCGRCAAPWEKVRSPKAIKINM